MIKVTEVIKTLEKTKQDNWEKYCKAFGMNYPYPWCASYVSKMMKEVGINYPWSTSCNQQISALKTGKFDYTYQAKNFGKLEPLDIVYYEFDNVKDADHVGICISVDYSKGTAKIIEGNKGDLPDNQTRVGIREISIYDTNLIFGVARIKPSVVSQEESTTYKETNYKGTIKDLPMLQRWDKGKPVENLQAILEVKGYSCGSGHTDGYFGEDTEKAVTNYQTDHKLEVDGIVGSETWSSLFKG